MSSIVLDLMSRTGYKIYNEDTFEMINEHLSIPATFVKPDEKF